MRGQSQHTGYTHKQKHTRTRADTQARQRWVGERELGVERTKYQQCCYA